MRIESLRTQHPWLTMSTALLVFMAFWSIFTAQSHRSLPFHPEQAVDDSAVLVAKAGHVLPIFDRHIPFSLEKRNGHLTFVLKK